MLRALERQVGDRRGRVIERELLPIAPADVGTAKELVDVERRDAPHRLADRWGATGSSFQGPGRQAADELPLQNEVNEDDRDKRNDQP